LITGLPHWEDELDNPIDRIWFYLII
jgi:hypothetical protein